MNWIIRYRFNNVCLRWCGRGKRVFQVRAFPPWSHRLSNVSWLLTPSFVFLKLSSISHSSCSLLRARWKWVIMKETKQAIFHPSPSEYEMGCRAVCRPALGGMRDTYSLDRSPQMCHALRPPWYVKEGRGCLIEWSIGQLEYNTRQMRQRNWIKKPPCAHWWADAADSLLAMATKRIRTRSAMTRAKETLLHFLSLSAPIITRPHL